MSTRVQVVLDESEREAFRRRAEAEGMSLSAWFLGAARRRFAEGRTGPLTDSRALSAFLAGVPDARAAEREPEWEEHLSVMTASRAGGHRR